MNLLSFFSKNKNIVKQMSVNEIFKILIDKDNDYVFIDVREPNEWKYGVIPGIKKISMGEIEKHFPELDKDANYILVCRSGNRSGKVAEKMFNYGYRNIINFKGGMIDWYSKSLPTE